MLKSIEKTRSDVERFISELFSSGYIKEENKFLIKPNIVSREGYPTTTDPVILDYVLGGLCNYCEADNLIVVDGPAPDKVYILEDQTGPSARVNAERYHKEFRERFSEAEDFPDELIAQIECLARSTVTCSDLASVSKHYGVECSSLYDRFKFIPVKTQSTIVRIADTHEYDVILDLSVLKLHSHCGYSGALKNLYGLIYHFDKNVLHNRVHTNNFNFIQFISDLPKFFNTKIIAVTDISHVQDSQEKIWGAGNVYELGDFIVVGNPEEVNIQEVLMLNENNLLRPYFYSNQRSEDK